MVLPRTLPRVVIILSQQAAVADLMIVPMAPGSSMSSQIKVTGKRFSLADNTVSCFGRLQIAAQIKILMK